jgi:hypothetical protein
MAWKDAWAYTSKLFNNEKSDAKNSHHQAQREDANLPLKARIGSVVTLQKTPLIRAQTQGSLLELPAEDESLIVAISRLQTNLNGELLRYYINLGDDKATEKFLQIYVDTNGAIREIWYCSGLSRIIPETSEDQAAFTGSAGYGLGDRAFTLWRQQLEEVGLDSLTLDTAFGEQDALTYQRDAGDPQLEFLAPFRGTETRIDNAEGTAGLQQEVIFMPYSRNLGGEESGQREILLISTEIVESENGDRNKRSIHVDFMIAIPIDVERLVVQ